MKRFLIIVTLVLYFFGSSPQDGICEQQQLNWLGHWKDDDKREQLVLEVKKEFEFLHPEITVQFLFNKDLDRPGSNYKFKTANEIVNMIQTGNIRWDVIFLGGAVYNHVAELLDDPDWGPKHLVDFSAVPGFLQTQKDFIVADPYYRNQTGGIFVGPLIEGFVTCLWFNPEVARKAGITVRERRMTVNEFIDYARQLSEYNRKNKSTIPFIKLCTWNRLEILFEYLFKTQFTDPQAAISEEYSDTKRKAFLDTLLIFEQLSRYQPILNEDWQTLEWDQWKRDYLHDEGLFIVAGTYMYSLFRGIDPEKFEKIIPIELPYVRQPNGLVGDYINTFAVMKKSGHKDVAIDLLMLWSEPKVAEKWVRYTKNPTGIKGNLDDPVSKALTNNVYNSFIRDMDTQYRNLPMRYFREPSYVFGSKNPVTANELRIKLAHILEGKLSAREYFDDVMQRFLMQ